MKRDNCFWCFKTPLMLLEVSFKENGGTKRFCSSYCLKQYSQGCNDDSVKRLCVEGSAKRVFNWRKLNPFKRG